MRISRLFWLAIAGVALAVPGVSLGDGVISPANGNFTGTSARYTSSHKHRVAKVAVTVRGHDVYGFGLTARVPPLNRSDSHGNACRAIKRFRTKGYGASGSMATDGSFDYTFTQYRNRKGVIVATDTITLKGTFTDPLHVQGTFRDVLVASRKSRTGAAHCDSGTVAFTASHH